MKIQKYDFNIWTPYLLRNGSKLNHQSSVNSINIRPLLISNIMEWNSYVDIQQANSKCLWNYFLPWEIVKLKVLIQWSSMMFSLLLPAQELNGALFPAQALNPWRFLSKLGDLFPAQLLKAVKKINSITQRPKMIYDVFVKLRKE